jgi:outer membrane protein OmpA-like peptidoglycan-associated protein
MQRKSFASISTVLLTAAIGACAHTVPKELVAARTAYDRSSHGETAARAPVELHKAEVALRTAEQAYDDEPEGQVTKDLAYVALRRVQVADVAATRKAQAEMRLEADAVIKAAAARKQADTSGALAQAQKDLNSAQQGELSAEARNKEMAARLAELANVSQDDRGTVVTLAGSLLFPSNKATLSATAEERLEKLSEALKEDKEHAIRIEGFTDSRGSDSTNMALSRRRAEAVRAFLVSRGHEPSSVEAEGKGEAQPIASNDDPEGRATNRRVEIVVNPK